MAGMIPTLKLTVNLQCKLCRRKIRKVLGKLEDREKIQPPKYNEAEGTVIVSGPFDPKKLSKKLCCKACTVILDIQEIVEEKPDPPPSPVKPDPPPSPVKPDPPPSPVKPKPQKPEYIYLYPYPYPYPQPYSYTCPTVWPFIPLCGCNGSCRCKSIVEPPPPPANPAPAPTFSTPCYDGCRSCKFICEEEPSTCSIM